MAKHCPMQFLPPWPHCHHHSVPAECHPLGGTGNLFSWGQVAWKRVTATRELQGHCAQGTPTTSEDRLGTGQGSVSHVGSCCPTLDVTRCLLVAASPQVWQHCSQMSVLVASCPLPPYVFMPHRGSLSPLGMSLSRPMFVPVPISPMCPCPSPCVFTLTTSGAIVLEMPGLCPSGCLCVPQDVSVAASDTIFTYPITDRDIPQHHVTLHDIP